MPTRTMKELFCQLMINENSNITWQSDRKLERKYPELLKKALQYKIGKELPKDIMEKELESRLEDNDILKYLLDSTENEELNRNYFLAFFQEECWKKSRLFYSVLYPNPDIWKKEESSITDLEQCFSYSCLALIKAISSLKKKSRADEIRNINSYVKGRINLNFKQVLGFTSDWGLLYNSSFKKIKDALKDFFYEAQEIKEKIDSHKKAHQIYIEICKKQTTVNKHSQGKIIEPTDDQWAKMVAFWNAQYQSNITKEELKMMLKTVIKALRMYENKKYPIEGDQPVGKDGQDTIIGNIPSPEETKVEAEIKETIRLILNKTLNKTLNEVIHQSTRNNPLKRLLIDYILLFEYGLDIDQKDIKNLVGINHQSSISRDLITVRKKCFERLSTDRELSTLYGFLTNLSDNEIDQDQVKIKEAHRVMKKNLLPDIYNAKFYSKIEKILLELNTDYELSIIFYLGIINKMLNEYFLNRKLVLEIIIIIHDKIGQVFQEIRDTFSLNYNIELASFFLFKNSYNKIFNQDYLTLLFSSVLLTSPIYMLIFVLARALSIQLVLNIIKDLNIVLNGLEENVAIKDLLLNKTEKLIFLPPLEFTVP